MQIEGVVMKGAVFIFLSMCAVFDIRKKEIPFVLTITGSTAAAGLAFWQIGNKETSVIQVIFSLMPGILFLVISWCTKEKVGYGDGILILITGLCVGFYDCFFGLCIGLFLSALYALFLLLIHKAEKNSSIPFVPFLTMGMGVCFVL